MSPANWIRDQRRSERERPRERDRNTKRLKTDQIFALIFKRTESGIGDSQISTVRVGVLVFWLQEQNDSLEFTGKIDRGLFAVRGRHRNFKDRREGVEKEGDTQSVIQSLSTTGSLSVMNQCGLQEATEPIKVVSVPPTDRVLSVIVF